MYGSGLCRRLTPVSRVCSRHFHVSPRCQAGDTIHDVLSQIPPLHNVFQQVHDYTALPWLISIPVATFLMRSLITLPRVYYATRDQKLNPAIRSLQLEAIIVEQQGNIRLATGRENVEQNDEWKKKTWLARRNEVEKRYKSLKPSAFFSPSSKLNIANMMEWALFSVNTSTLFSLSNIDPLMFGFESIQEWCQPIFVYLFFPIALSNTAYFRGSSVPSSFQLLFSLISVRPDKWSRVQRRMVYASVLPCAVMGGLLLGCPIAVVLFALSNSIYTSWEIAIIGAITKNQTLGYNSRPRATSQTTKLRKLREDGQWYS